GVGWQSDRRPRGPAGAELGRDVHSLYGATRALVVEKDLLEELVDRARHGPITAALLAARRQHDVGGRIGRWAGGGIVASDVAVVIDDERLAGLGNHVSWTAGLEDVPDDGNESFAHVGKVLGRAILAVKDRILLRGEDGQRGCAETIFRRRVRIRW